MSKKNRRMGCVIPWCNLQRGSRNLSFDFFDIFVFTSVNRPNIWATCIYYAYLSQASDHTFSQEGQEVVGSSNVNSPHWSFSLLLIWVRPLPVQSFEGSLSAKTAGCLPLSAQCEREWAARGCPSSRSGHPSAGRDLRGCSRRSWGFGRRPWTGRRLPFRCMKINRCNWLELLESVHSELSLTHS